MYKTIHLFRHGLTDWNSQRRLQGHTNVPLNDEGRKQATTLQPYFQKNSVNLFMSSDLIRAQETAHIANTFLQLPLHSSPLFREAALGELEGLTLHEAQEKYGSDNWERWTSLDPKNFDFTYPQAESANQAIARFSEGLKKFCEDFPFESAGLCTHGLIMRRFLHSLRPDLQEPLPIPNCVVYTVQWSLKDRKFYFNS